MGKSGGKSQYSAIKKGGPGEVMHREGDFYHVSIKKRKGILEEKYWWKEGVLIW